VRRPGAALVTRVARGFVLKLACSARYQSGARPPHSKEALKNQTPPVGVDRCRALNFITLREEENFSRKGAKRYRVSKVQSRFNMNAIIHILG